MGWFRDDFYSTKVPRSFRGKGGLGISGRSIWGVAAVSVVAGSLLTLLLAAAVGDEDSNEAVPALAMPETKLERMEAGRGLNELIQETVARVNPAVVSVLCRFSSDEGTDDFGSEKDSGEKDSGSSPWGDLPNVGIGSGVIFEQEDGEIRVITNNHVIDGADIIEIVLPNGKKKKAELLGKDVYSDLALLAADDDGVDSVAVLGDSDDLHKGEAVIAIGNALGLGYGQTVTTGVISSLNLPIQVSLTEGGPIDWEMEVIQTDAAINQGNSGGPLLNVDGEVIGINSRKVAELGVEGLGFALPINDVKVIIGKLAKEGKVDRPFMGISPLDLQNYQVDPKDFDLPKDVKTGVIIVEPVGPSEKAGLKTDDVIVELDGHRIHNTIELRKYLFNEKKIGDELEVGFYRKGKKMELTVQLSVKEDK